MIAFPSKLDSDLPELAFRLQPLTPLLIQEL
jgi:hypothetical protein